MASKSKSRPAARRAPFQPQDLLFAGIGAVSLGRKKAEALVAKAGPAARDAAAFVRDAQAQGREAANEAAAKVLEFAVRAESVGRQQLAPVLAKLGIKAKKAAPKPRAAHKKGTSRRRRAA